MVIVNITLYLQLTELSEAKELIGDAVNAGTAEYDSFILFRDNSYDQAGGLTSTVVKK